jgi:hypothetical protein
MNRIFLTLILLGAGGGAFLTARQSTMQIQHEARMIREAWLAQTQRIAAAQSEQAGLNEHVRDLKQTLAQFQPAAGSELWSALQTNRADRLPPELRLRLLDELGFNWTSSEDFILVSKQTLRDIGMLTVEDGKLSDLAATVLALTQPERERLEAALGRFPADYGEWAVAHVQRDEPKDEVLARYALPADLAMSLSTRLANMVIEAVGRERCELVMPYTLNWLRQEIGCGDTGGSLTVKREVAGNLQRLKVELRLSGMCGYPSSLNYLTKYESYFPKAFRPIFPNGWADVAKREGFELPP